MNSVEGASEEAFTLSRAQVAQRLGLSPERVRQLASSGDLNSTRTSLGRLFRLSEVDAYRRKRTERTQSHDLRSAPTPKQNPDSDQPSHSQEKE